jgi:neutral ceramidase
MKWFRIAAKSFLIAIISLVVLIALLILVSVIPVDRTPYRQHAYYRVMMHRLDSLMAHTSLPEATRPLAVGYSKVSLTPNHRTATAGYGNRKGKRFAEVRDSVFVRALVLDNGGMKVAIVSADLLIIPPLVTVQLNNLLADIGFSLNNTYLSATHTHNSIGHWGEGATRFIYGAYQDSIVQFISHQIVNAIAAADENKVASTLRAGAIAVPEAVFNRLDEHAAVDSTLHVLEVRREDGRVLLLTSYTAHATCLYSKDVRLSGDYPGELVRELENEGYEFAMFLAGAMGSHGCNAPQYGDTCIDWMADHLTRKVVINRAALTTVHDPVLYMVRIPLELNEPQVRVSENWRVRPWLFRTAFGEYPQYLTALRVGNVVMLGTPCDFSGELTAPLTAFGKEKGLHVMVTSFNGGYIGYITADEHYDKDHYETQLMNWYGPGNGKYLTECLYKLIEVLAQ